jgi:hypothetical protein
VQKLRADKPADLNLLEIKRKQLDLMLKGVLMNVNDVKNSILKAVGNQSGAFVEYAGVIAQAIVKDFGPEEEKTVEPVKEIRVVKAQETR